MRVNEYAEFAIFIAVAEERNFRQAAARLNLTPSTLSQSVRSLEARLGVQLLNRTTRTVAPTEAGKILLLEISDAFRTIDAAVERVNAFRSRPRGTVRLNVPEAAAKMVLARRFGAFARSCPDVVLELTIDNGMIDIVRDGYDAGIRLGHRVEQDMVSIRLTDDLRAAIIASPAYLARHGVPKSPLDLTRHRCINRRYANESALHRWRFKKGGRQLSVAVSGPFVANSDDMLLAAALDDVGIAFMAESDVASHVADGRLVRLLDDWCQNFPGFFLYHPVQRQPSASLTSLIEILTTPVDELDARPMIPA